MIGLDSCAIIDFYRGDLNIKNLIESCEEILVVNNICYLEIINGIDYENSKHKTEEKYYDYFFESLKNLNLDIKSCKKSSEILWDQKKQGKIIEVFDCVIAGIYLSNGVKKIITRNKKHFENIKDLEIVSY